MNNAADNHQSLTNFYSSLTNDEVKSTGENQWKAMSDLERYYEDLPMKQFGDSKFSDDVWKTNRDGVNINWHSVLKSDERSYPFVLATKIALYQRVEVQKLSSSASANGLIPTVKLWNAFLRRENILSAKTNQPFLPAQVMTKEKLERMCMEAVEQGALKSDYPLSFWSLLLLKLPEHSCEKAPFLRFNFEVPWHKQKWKAGEISPAQVYVNNLLGESATRLSIKSFEPFSSNTVAKIIDNAIPIITTHSRAIANFFAKAQPLISIRSDLEEDGCTEIFNKELQNLLVKTKGEHPDLCPFFELFDGTGVSYSWLYRLHKHCLSAAVWIISLTTGLRNIDIRLSLNKEGCWLKDPDSEMIHYIVTDIQKVSINDYPIPVPPITIEAIKLLQNINFSSPDVDNLICRLSLFGSSKYFHFNDGHQFNTMLRDFASVYDIDLLEGLESSDNEDGVCHRSRVTLAQWIGTNSPLSVLIVKRLFGHTNEIMPDHYLKNNKLVIEERQRIQRLSYENLADQASDAIVEGKYSGGIKEMVNKDVVSISENIKANNKSLTAGEVRSNLKEQIRKVLISRLENGDMLGLQTPLGFVCMRSQKSVKPSPCAGKEQNNSLKDANIDKRLARALQGSSLPNLDNCQGANCEHSLLFDSEMTRLLHETFHYYINYLKGVGRYQIEHLETEAQNFIDLYYQPLKDVYPEIKLELDSIEAN